MQWWLSTATILALSLAQGDAFSVPSGQVTRAATSRSSSSVVVPKATTGDGTSQSTNQNVWGQVSDATTGLIFSLLHAFDPDPIQDSSKNLRVLWVRALLHHRGMIEDEIAQTFLPPTTRGLVTTSSFQGLWDPVVKFTEWIQARTEFIDGAVEHFLSSPIIADSSTEGPAGQIVLLGAGYDTRALRFRHSNVQFYEVDLPDVTAGKEILYKQFQKNEDPDWDREGKGSRLVPMDLNDCEQKNYFMERLQEFGLKMDQPTMFVSEAVLFYVNEQAVRNIFDDMFQFAGSTEAMVCITDSLKPFVSVPFTNEARTFFDTTGNMELLEHRSRWGGAVHFALAGSRRPSSAQAVTNSTGAVAASVKFEKGKLASHVDGRVDGIVHSYTPTRSNNPKLLKEPSFENVWYAVAYPWQIDGYETPLDAVMDNKNNKDRSDKPFATRLWGEPLVIYRDAKGELVALADVCPHRSAPLSMGSLKENGVHRPWNRIDRR